MSSSAYLNLKIFYSLNTICKILPLPVFLAPVIFFRSDETSWICENELHLMKETRESQINTEHNFIEQHDSVENNWENLLTW